MTTWEAIPLDVHAWPLVLDDQDVVIVDWREELRKRELEQGQTQAGQAETRRQPKAKNRQGSGRKRVHGSEGPAIPAEAALPTEEHVTADR
eukprot:1196512-Rhodomonas_salina.1